MNDEIKISITQPKFFKKRAIVFINAYGTIGLIPICILVILVPLYFKFLKPECAITLSVGGLIFVIILNIFLNPNCISNLYVRKLIRYLNPLGQGGYIVQIAKIPRWKSGFWAFVEDADDIGLLSLTEDSLVFKGDSVDFSCPYTRIKNIYQKNIGWRGSWIYYGNRIRIDISDPTGEKSFDFCERSSLTVPASRKTTNELFNRLSAKIQK